MRKTFEISGDSSTSLLYAVQIGALLLLLCSLIWTVDGFASALLVVLFASLVIAAVVGLWREKTGRDGDHLGTVEDIVYDPLEPGQAAKQRWRQSINRLPGVDDEDQEN